MKKILSIILIILVAMPFVLAQPSNNGSKVLADKNGNVMMNFPANQSFCQQMSLFRAAIVGSKLPSALPYKDEVFHIYYTSKKPFGTLVLKNSTVKKFTCDIVDNATFNVYISGDKVLKSLEDSDNPLDTYNAAVKSGDIRLEGVTFSKKVKAVFTNMVARIASWFI